MLTLNGLVLSYRFDFDCASATSRLLYLMSLSSFVPHPIFHSTRPDTVLRRISGGVQVIHIRISWTKIHSQSFCAIFLSVLPFVSCGEVAVYVVNLLGTPVDNLFSGDDRAS